MATIIKLVCQQCNKSFTVIKGREKLFCCKKCKLEHRKEKDKIFYIEKHCECCNKLFTSKKKDDKKCCSYKCAGKMRTNKSKEKRTCLVCGKVFSERVKHKRKFCSEKCRKSWQAKPENIKSRINKTKEANLKKYGVESTFQVDSLREKALINLRKTYKSEKGKKVVENNNLKLKQKRDKVLVEKFKEKGYIILEFNNKYLKIQHPDGHIFEGNRKLLNSRLNHGTEISTVLLPIGSPRTTFEIKICNFLKENNIKYISNDRRTIKGELDIYIPKYKIAIEINGLYWHCEKYHDKKYHLNKTEQCLKKGIELLHFFEDELIEKYEIIENIIRTKLNLNTKNTNINNYYIKPISEIDANNFLYNNSLCDSIKSDVRIGLFYNTDLVSLMCFKSIENDEYELQYFSDKLNENHEDKLIELYQYFKSNYVSTSIIAFDDRRYSKDNQYLKLGFRFIKHIKPDYKYVVKKRRINKELIGKDKKYYKIFDCGKSIWKDDCK